VERDEICPLLFWGLAERAFSQKSGTALLARFHQEKSQIPYEQQNNTILNGFFESVYKNLVLKLKEKGEGFTWEKRLF
jgi:hypothetical protein